MEVLVNARSAESRMDPKKKQTYLALQSKFLSVTRENTKLLKEVAVLKEQHMKLNEDIKDVSSCNEKRDSQKSHQSNAASEKSKLVALASRQEQEIELLNLEIQSLKTKCGHVSVGSCRLPIL